jgi:hypothetical protein
VAAYLHLVLLLALGLFVFEAPVKTSPLVLYATLADVDQTAETPVMHVETVPEEEGAEPEVSPEPDSDPEEPSDLPDHPLDQPLEPFESNELARYLDAALREAERSDQAETPAKPAEPVSAGKPGESFRSAPSQLDPAPVPPHAVTSGRFSAWTEPASPKPGQPYRIVILVRLPSHITRYYSSDLTGMVIGFDGYRKVIRSLPRQQLPLVNHTARIAIPVVGSEHGWKDTIVVYSGILRERRVLELVYRR